MPVTKINIVLWDDDEGLAGDFTHGQTYILSPGISEQAADQLMKDLKAFMANYACKLSPESRLIDPEEPAPEQNKV